MTGIPDHSGTWAGSNAFRLMPTDEPHVAGATARVTVNAGGHVTSIAYAWSHADDGQQDGVLVFGPGDEPGSIVAFWGDSWHQSPGPRVLHGTIDGGLVDVGYSYAEGWDWRIVVDATDADTLRLRMDNSGVHDGVPFDPYPAMLATFRRDPGTLARDPAA